MDPFGPSCTTAPFASASWDWWISRRHPSPTADAMALLGDVERRAPFVYRLEPLIARSVGMPSPRTLGC